MTTILIVIIAMLIVYYAYKYKLYAAENMHVDGSSGIILRMNNPFGVPCWSCDNSLMYKYKPTASKDNHNRCCKWP
jgi:hypothetical protein